MDGHERAQRGDRAGERSHDAPAESPPVVISKARVEDNFFTLAGTPDGFVEKSRAIVSSLGALLLDVKFEDVASENETSGKLPASTARVRTFDGLVAHLECFKLDDKQYVRFHFEFDPAGVVAPQPGAPAELADTGSATVPAATEEPVPAPPSVEDEVAALNARVSGWVYALPDYKMRMLEKALAEMIKPVEKPQAPTARGE